MTDLTPAQIVKLAEQLRELEYTSCDQAATLIEQQAEQIAAMTTELEQTNRLGQEAVTACRSAESEVAALTAERDSFQRQATHFAARGNKAESEAAALRKAIEEATPVDTDVPPMTHQGLKDWIEKKQWELITGHRVEKDRK